MAENLDLPRPIVIATEAEPEADYDLHYTLARLPDDVIDKIAERVVALLRATRSDRDQIR